MYANFIKPDMKSVVSCQWSVGQLSVVSGQLSVVSG